MNAPSLTLTKKDYATDQEVRWCPGCGDYAILAATQQAFAELGLVRENVVVVSGIGCSSRMPYYMNTFGFHTIHGRAPAVATGIKLTQPQLSVWLVTGDGDGLSIGGNHLIHLLRRNLDINVLLFDNRIYGLTKGQYSPTSEVGKRTKSSPLGTVDRPFQPLSLALGAGATFLARTIDVFAPHLKDTLVAAEAHRGTSFIQIYQNCNIFNDGAFEGLRDKATRDEKILVLEHGKPLVFGKSGEYGIRLRGLTPEVVALGAGISESDLLVHDERGPLAYTAMLADMQPPEFPVPVGILRRIEAPTLDAATRTQLDAAVAARGTSDLQRVIAGGNTWEVR